MFINALVAVKDNIMRINIWIRVKSLDDLNYYLSDDFRWDKEMQLDIWYEQPSAEMWSSNEFLSVSLTYYQYKKLEDL